MLPLISRHKERIVKLCQALGITVLAFTLSLVIMQPFTFSAATLISQNKNSDFDITDFYNVIADGRAVRTIDRDITILDIDGATREDVGHILAALPDFGPRAIGLDVMFDTPHDDDSELIEAVRNLPDMVMIVDVDPDRERNANSFHIGETSFFANMIPGQPIGASNLPTKNAGGVVREFRPWYPTLSGDTVPAFAVAVAAIADSTSIARLKARNRNSEIINYPSRSFRSFNWLDLSYNAELVRDHILLIGNMQSRDDRHATPKGSRMSGVEIHALSLATILNDTYITPISPVWNYVIAFGLCFLLAFFHLSLPAEFKTLVLRLVQIGMLYVVIVVGYHCFIAKAIVINFSYTLLMLTFLLFACDIWLSTIGIRKYYKKIKAKIQESKSNTIRP